MTTMNEKIKQKIYSDSSFAIKIYEDLELSPTEYFYDKILLNDGMEVSNGKNLIFLTARCVDDTFPKYLFEKDRAKIFSLFNNFSQKEVANKLCYQASLNNTNLDAFCFIVEQWMKNMSTEASSEIKNDIIKNFIAFTEADIFSVLVEKNIITIETLKSYSDNNDYLNKSIANIICKESNCQNLIEKSITILREKLDLESENEKYGRNIIIDNHISALKVYLSNSTEKLNHHSINYLFNVSNILKDQELYALTTKNFLIRKKENRKIEKNNKKRI